MQNFPISSDTLIIAIWFVAFMGLVHPRLGFFILLCMTLYASVRYLN